MPLQPAILIGVGGSGDKSLRTLRQTLLRRLRAVGWESHELPAAWQMVAIDTITVNTADGYPEQLLPGSNYLGLVPPDVAYGAIRESLTQKVPAAERQDAFAGWLTKEIATPVYRGAGQNRAIGRAVSAYGFKRIHDRLKVAYDECRSPAALAELGAVQRLLGADEGSIPRVLPFVISSLAGGTGSGMFVDVVEALAMVHPNLGEDVQTVLFGPDVFGPLLAGDAGTGIAANTLAAVGSVTAGVWARNPSSATQSLYTIHGLKGFKEGGGVLTTGWGARYNYVIGAINANGASVGVMDEAYRAAGESIAAVLSDQSVLDDFQNFFKVNVFSGSWSYASVGDRSKLHHDLERYTQPFASFGSAKLSLGLGRFVEYASQAITRTTVERLLWPALEQADPNDPRTDDAKINDEVQAQWKHFLESSTLNEQDLDGAPHDDVVDALRSPELGAMAETMASSLLAKASAGATNKGLDVSKWLRNIQTYLEVGIADFMANAELARRPVAKQWVDSQRQNLPALLTRRASGRGGLAVALGLAEKLRADVRYSASVQLPPQAEAQRRTLDDLPARLSSLLTETGLTHIEPGHPIFAQVKALIAKAALMQEGAARYRLASALLLDLEENYLAPLSDGLRLGRAELLQRVRADQLDDGRPNPLSGYPRLGQPAGKQFQPGPTELLLVDPADYPDMLRDLTMASLEPDDREQWTEHLIASTVAGASLNGRQLSDSFLRSEPGWVTRVSEAQATTAAMPVKAQVVSVARPIQFLDRASSVLEDSELALGKYVVQPLRDFLSPADPVERNRRRSDFTAKLVQAFSIGAPLVQENKILMANLHPGRGTKPLSIVSRIPVDPTDEHYTQIEGALTAAGFWNSDMSPKWFGHTNAAEITVFQASPSASSAMALSSLMQPVIKRWMAQSADPDSRRGFWKLKRARPLMETIPMVPEAFNNFIEGWLMSGILGQRELDSPQPNLGWRTRVWVSTAKQMVDFPYPLLGTDGGDKEQLPGVMISLLIAMADCDLKSSLTPLLPYQRVIELGRDLAGPDDELANWIRNAVLLQDAPVPPPNWAGTAQDTLDTRRERVRDGLDKSLNSYEQHFHEVEKSQDPFLTTLAWELREPIRRAHESILQSITKVTDSADSLS